MIIGIVILFILLTFTVQLTFIDTEINFNKIQIKCYLSQSVTGGSHV